MQKVRILLYLLMFGLPSFAQSPDTELEARIRIMVRNEIEARLIEVSKDKSSVCNIQTFSNYFERELEFANTIALNWRASWDFFAPGKIESFKIQVKKQCCQRTGKPTD